jgi:hypothetical protein
MLMPPESGSIYSEEDPKIRLFGTEDTPLVTRRAGSDAHVDLAESLSRQEAAHMFLKACGLTPTPDAIAQLTEAFLPCLRIMCTRPWNPHGGTWRQSGILGVLTDAKKKWERFWERTWKHGQRHDDSGFDLINYIGFIMRSDPDSRWGEWGEPGNPGDEL